MKRKIITSLTVFFVVIIGFVFAQNNPTAESKYLIIQYSLGRNGTIDFYPGTSTKIASFKCNGWNLDCVVDILSQYKDQGYKVESMTSTPNGSLINGQILLSKD